MSIQGTAVDKQYYEVATPGSVAERLTALARDKIFADFMRIAQPQPDETILDVGISDIVGSAANVLERSYPFPYKITALGLGSATEFQVAYPEIRYRQIVPNQELPFPDNAFDVGTANAVLEHVGSPSNQRLFLAELCRVAERVFVAVPNRYFPVEHHTGIPILHWTDSSFAWACDRFGKTKWGETEHLILMSKRKLNDLCPPGYAVRVGYTGIVLGPLSGNLYCYLQRA